MVDQLADEHHQPVLRPDGAQRLRRLAGAAGEGGAVVGGGRGRGEALAQALQAGAGRGALARREAVDIHAGRAEPRAAGQLRVAHRLPQALRRVAGADQHAAGAGEALARERHEALRVALDGELERAAVDLHRVGHAEPLQRAGEDHRAHHQVVGERDVGPHALGHLAHRGHVALQVAVDLGLVEVLERARLHALVAIGHVERQQARDVGPVDRHAGGLAAGLQRQLAAVPVAGGVDPVVGERVAVLAEQVDLVARARERLRERGVVDVGAGAPEQVAVEDEDAHEPVQGMRRTPCYGSPR